MENIEPRLDAQNILSAGSRWGPALVQSPILRTPDSVFEDTGPMRVPSATDYRCRYHTHGVHTAYSVQCTVAYQADSQN